MVAISLSTLFATPKCIIIVCDNGLHLFINFKTGNNHKITRIMIVPNWMIIKMVTPSKKIADAELTLYKKGMRQD